MFLYNCQICKDKGYVMMTEYQEVDNETIRKYNNTYIKMPYTFALDCICKGGTLISKYFDINELKKDS